MFSKILIANRGEIACRIQRTLKKMGIQSVAVYSDVDKHAKHVLDCDFAFPLGGSTAKESYLDAEKILKIAKDCGAQAIHPGYGFLSENAEFAQAAEKAGIAFIGPTSSHLIDFGLKHKARELAEAASVPLLPGTGVLRSVEEALEAATDIGYPVMLKSSAGGGGIGMRLCYTAESLKEEYTSVEDLAKNNFGNADLFLEKFVSKARHIEVQIFGDAKDVVSLGERDCSVQRRNQKVIEETPAPCISEETRKSLHETAVALAKSVNYKSAGTLEFIYDTESKEFYFLEVNTRLQVEHGVTEEVTGYDLVEWMIRIAAGESLPAKQEEIKCQGHSIQVRVYAEDPNRNFLPSSGLLSHVEFDESVRNDTWVESGSEISPFYDPLLAKIIVHEESRSKALEKLQSACSKTTLYGIVSNLEYLKQILINPDFAQGSVYTKLLDQFEAKNHSFEVIDGGMLTTVQDYPGRLNYWHVGVPPSGPMDTLGFRLGNSILGNEKDAAGLECTLNGPTLKFNCKTKICLTGAKSDATLDGKSVEAYTAIEVDKGSTLKVGKVIGAGQRIYVSILGGLDIPEYLGSRSTFDLGKFGGHCGRKLLPGDVLPLFEDPQSTGTSNFDSAAIPEIGNTWKIRVLYGPHGAPDFFKDTDLTSFFDAEWEVHFNSARTGVRLIGPKPEWARKDGGEAGLHPSNIHDNAYAQGTIDFTGDMPIILGPDGPSLGGFVCPATIIRADLWKCGQLKPGDKIKFELVSREDAKGLFETQDCLVNELKFKTEAPSEAIEFDATKLSPILHTSKTKQAQVDVVYRQAGEDYLLIEMGPLVLDITLRARIHSLMVWLEENTIEGLVDITPGIRSLQVHFDSAKLSVEALLKHLERAEEELPAVEDMSFPARIVHLPLSWDDPSTKLAIEKYSAVRKDAPWCPSNIEFIRRINGLDSIQDVQDILFNASYLVMGLGDVYLGAPVATPMDPRHRLVTTKYNPARTWTPENAVGIGGAYMCVYGMEGPGGYQFVGRTIQMWNRYRETQCFEKGSPWLLRFFDQIRFYPVSTDELSDMRDGFIFDKYAPKIEETSFKLKDYVDFLDDNSKEIKAFKDKQSAAFEEERLRWVETGQDVFVEEESNLPLQDEDTLEDIEFAARAQLPGSVWKILVKEGDTVEKGQTLLVLESMKMEVPVTATESGIIQSIQSKEGQSVSAGQRLMVLTNNT